MILGYFDENDGVAQLEVRWGTSGCVELNQNLASPGPSAQSLVRTTVTRGYRSTRGEDRDRRNTQPESRHGLITSSSSLSVLLHLAVRAVKIIL